MSHRRYAYCLGANGPRSSWYEPLKYAEKDAERLATALATSPCNFVETTWGVATDRNSTLAGLSQFVKQCQSPDLLIVHFSGHAILDEELYLLCNETECDDLVSSAIEIGAMKKILSRSLAGYNLLILDCCHAGGAHRGAFKGEQDVQNALNQAFQGSANVILSACARYERTRELGTLDGGAGFLSWALAAACTTRFRETSYDGHSLSLANILRWLPLVLKEINRSLNEDGQLPLPEALIYTRGGDGEIWFTEPDGLISSRIEHDARQDRERRLKAMLADHSGFIRDRLESFVGRQLELKAIRERIAEKLQTGGYVTITGQAGQGKSSIIAKLVAERGTKETAFHFIPLNPGPDHQVGLLRNLMARLILKYDLPDLYIASESRPALRDYFPRVLEEVVTKCGQEVIFIDGLDQLEEEHTGLRDLSFLPNNPPSGIVFVLGTRPNDTLMPLELLKPRHEYRLPNLSRQDFDLILKHRQVSLEPGLADQFYQVMQANALYLDLVAKELRENKLVSPQKIITRIADNPENLFSLAMSRLKRPATEWREVIKPVFGLLLAAREPLSMRSIRQILGVEDERLRDGIIRLGGLLAEDGQHQYSLFHLKLYDYLRQDEHNPTKEYMFAADEEEGWHKMLAQWCEQGDPSMIWRDTKRDLAEQKRRLYARQHYITHLYLAKEWQQLFRVLDKAEFGRAKVNYDPSTRLYAQDLNLGRQAAADGGQTMEQGMDSLPHLWRYTLLQCSLASRADRYPLEAFRLLVMLNRSAKAIGLAELLTNSQYKVNVLLHIAIRMRKQQGQEVESVEVLMRACEVARTIVDGYKQAEALRQLAKALGQVGQWEKAETVISTIARSDTRAQALGELARALTQFKQWEKAETVISTIARSDTRTEALHELAKALGREGQWEQAEAVINKIVYGDVRANTLYELNYQRAEALHERSRVLAQAGQWEQAELVIDTIVHGDVRTRALQELRRNLMQSQQWERAEAVVHMIADLDTRAEALYELGIALARTRQWKRAEAVIGAIEDVAMRVKAACELGSTLAQAGQWERAKFFWDRTEVEIHMIADNFVRTRALYDLVKALAQARQWEQAEAMVGKIPDSDRKTRALYELAKELARAGQWKKAELVIGKIVYSYVRAEALHELARELTQAGQRKRAEIFWKQAEATVGTIANDARRVEVICELARKLVQAGQQERAEVFWEQAQAEVYMLELSDEHVEATNELLRELVQAGQWQRAEAVVGMIVEYDGQIEATCELGRLLVHAGQWERAEAVARMIAAPNRQVEMMCELLRELAQAGQWQRAEAVVGMITDHDRQIEATCELGKLLVHAGQWQRAEAVVGMITDHDRQIEATCELGRLLVHAGQRERAETLWKKAEAEIHKITDDHIRTEVLSKLLSPLVRAEQWKRAEVVIGAIPDRARRVKAVCELGSALAQAGQREGAEILWKKAEAEIRKVSDNFVRTRALRDLVKVLAHAGYWEQAEAVITKITDTRERVEALCELGRLLMYAEQWEGAEILWKKAKAEVQTITYKYEQTKLLNYLNVTQAEALRELAKDLTQAGQWEQTELVIGMMEGTEAQVEALCELGGSLAQAGKWKRAKALWKRVETMIYTIADSYIQTRILCKLVRVLAQVGQWEQAGSLLKKAERVIYPLTNNYLRTEALREVRDAQAKILSAQGRALVRAGKWEQAREIIDSIENEEVWAEVLPELGKALVQAGKWEQAREIIDSIENEEVLAEVLPELGKALVQAGKWEQAENFWQEAEVVIDSMANRYFQFEVLRTLGSILAQAGQWERASAFFRKADIKSTSEEVDLIEEDDELEVYFQGGGEVIDLIEEDDEQEISRSDMHTTVLVDLGRALAHTKQWEQAEEVINTIEDSITHFEALRDLAAILAIDNKYERVLNLVQRYWLQATTRESAIQLLPLAYELIPLKPEISTDFCECFTWVDTFLSG